MVSPFSSHEPNYFMPQLLHKMHFENVMRDAIAGLTTAVVSLPLALAFGVASGAGPLAGIWSAILAGFFAAVFGGTPTQITAPTGPMTVIVIALLREAGSLEVAFSSVCLAGVIQIAMGVTKLGNLVQFVPRPVVSGFMTGAGAIICVLEAAVVLGHDPWPTVTQSLLSLPTMIRTAHVPSAMVGLLAFALAMFIPKKITRVIPGALLALLVTTPLVAALGHGCLSGVTTIGAIPSGLPTFQMGGFVTALTNPTVVIVIAKYGLMLATLGVIDTLLTSLIADSLVADRVGFHDSNRELIGQGIGNTVSGLFGGLAAAGTTLCTVVNIKSGAHTPVSGALHSAFLILAILMLGDVVSLVPQPALGGILLKTGIDVMDWSFIRRIPTLPTAGWMVMGTVFSLTLLVDLMVACAAGVALSMVLTMRDQQRLQLASCVFEEVRGGLVVVTMTGPFDFASSESLMRRLSIAFRGQRRGAMDLSRVTHLDTSMVLMLRELAEKMAARNTPIAVAGLTGTMREELMQLGVGSFLKGDLGQGIEQAMARFEENPKSSILE